MRVQFGDVVVRANTKEDRFNTDKLYYVGGEHIETGEYLVTKRGLIAGSNIGPMFYFGFKKGQVLLASRSPDLKKAGMVTFDGICSEKTFVIETRDENVLLQSFLPIIVRSEAFWEYANNNQSGSVNHFINWSTFSAYEFDLPSLEEQRQLSEIVWAMVDAQRAYKALIAASDELVKSQFIKIITQLLEAGRTVPLDDLVEDDRPITYGILKPGTGCPSGVPVIKVKDMRDGTIDQSNLLLTTPELDYQYRRSRLRAGDLLISIRGSVGRMAEVPENLENANITQDTARLTLKSEYNKVYVRGVLESEPLQRDMERNIRGVAVKGINIGYLRELGIPICDRSEQDRLAHLYQQLDKSKHSAQKALEDLQTTQKALIRKYLG